MYPFNTGDKIAYVYLHHFNNRSSAMRTKKGVFVRYVKSKKNYRTNAVVLLDGNKGASTVKVDSLRQVID